VPFTSTRAIWVWNKDPAEYCVPTTKWSVSQTARASSPAIHAVPTVAASRIRSLTVGLPAL